MNSRSRSVSALVRSLSIAGAYAAVATFGFLADEGMRRQATDRALFSLLLAALPISIAFSVWAAKQPPAPFVVFGEDRRKVTLRYFAPLLLGWPLAGAGLAALVIAWTRGVADPRFVSDIVATLPVAFMAALSLVFASAATSAWLGRIGLIGLVILLLTLGQSEVLAAAVLPSAHVRHLLGVGAPLPFDPGWSMGALFGFCMLGCLAWLARVPR